MATVKLCPKICKCFFVDSEATCIQGTISAHLKLSESLLMGIECRNQPSREFPSWTLCKYLSYLKIVRTGGENFLRWPCSTSYFFFFFSPTYVCPLKMIIQTSSTLELTDHIHMHYLIVPRPHSVSQAGTTIHI